VTVKPLDPELHSAPRATSHATRARRRKRGYATRTRRSTANPCGRRQHRTERSCAFPTDPRRSTWPRAENRCCPARTFDSQSRPRYLPDVSSDRATRRRRADRRLPIAHWIVGRAMQCLPSLARITGSKRRRTLIARRGRSMGATVRGCHATPIQSRKQASAGPTRDTWFATRGAMA